MATVFDARGFIQINRQERKDIGSSQRAHASRASCLSTTKIAPWGGTSKRAALAHGNGECASRTELCEGEVVAGELLAGAHETDALHRHPLDVYHPPLKVHCHAREAQHDGASDTDADDHEANRARPTDIVLETDRHTSRT